VVYPREGWFEEADALLGNLGVKKGFRDDFAYIFLGARVVSQGRAVAKEDCRTWER